MAIRSAERGDKDLHLLTSLIISIMFDIYDFCIRLVIYIFCIVIQAHLAQKYYRQHKDFPAVGLGWMAATIWCFLYFLDFIKQYIDL